MLAAGSELALVAAAGLPEVRKFWEHSPDSVSDGQPRPLASMLYAGPFYKRPAMLVPSNPQFCTLVISSDRFASSRLRNYLEHNVKKRQALMTKTIA